MTVQLINAYAARSCAVRTQWNVLRPVDPEPPPAFLAGLAADGLAYEADVYQRLESLHPEAAVIHPDGSVVDREEATRVACDAGVPLVLAGRLPTDYVGRRVAQPDVLVRVGAVPVAGRWRYVAVDVKHHRVLAEEDAGAPVVVRDLADMAVPGDGDDVLAVGRRTPTIKGDLVQLAHYWRTLEAAGLVPTSPAWSGLLGAEGRIVWYRLDMPMWRHTSRSGVSAKLSSLGVYDLEFAQRLAIAAAAVAHRADPEQPLLVEPVRIGSAPSASGGCTADRSLPSARTFRCCRG